MVKRLASMKRGLFSSIGREVLPSVLKHEYRLRSPLCRRLFFPIVPNMPYKDDSNQAIKICRNFDTERRSYFFLFIFLFFSPISQIARIAKVFCMVLRRGPSALRTWDFNPALHIAHIVTEKRFTLNNRDRACCFRVMAKRKQKPV